MADIISVLVVLVFVVIVFRKRLALLFRGRIKPEEVKETETAAVDVGTLKKAEGCVYVHVFAIDTGNYLSIHDLADAIETNLCDRLAKIYTKYVGSYVGLDVITLNGILVFLLRWHT